MSWRNLDLDAALAAKQVLDRTPAEFTRQDIEGVATSAAAVLAVDGPYALFLYLLSREPKSKGRVCKEVFGGLYTHLASVVEGVAAESSHRKALDQVAGVSRDPVRLLTARKALMQALVYLRYQAKTRGAGQ